MFQILQHALADPANKTKFVLLFGNVEERDILLRDSFDKLSKKHPDTFKVVHVLEKQGTLDSASALFRERVGVRANVPQRQSGSSTTASSSSTSLRRART
jgi:NAD(P)H-flavin reductase